MGPSNSGKTEWVKKLIRGEDGFEINHSQYGRWGNPDKDVQTFDYSDNPISDKHDLIPKRKKKEEDDNSSEDEMFPKPKRSKKEPHYNNHTLYLFDDAPTTDHVKTRKSINEFSKISRYNNSSTVLALHNIPDLKKYYNTYLSNSTDIILTKECLRRSIDSHAQLLQNVTGMSKNEIRNKTRTMDDSRYLHIRFDKDGRPVSSTYTLSLIHISEPTRPY